MTRRITAITIAIVLAALGAAGGLYYLLSADQRAQDRVQDAVTVAVANSNITVGTTGARVRESNLVRFVRMPKANVPEDALTDFGATYDKLVLTSNVAKDQLLLKGNFGETSNVASGLPLEDGKIAITVQTGTPQQVGGHIRTGSEVVIYLTYTPISANGSKGLLKTKVLLRRVQIIAIGAANGQSGSLVTLAVTPGDAARLIEAVSMGTLYLGLLTDSVDVPLDGGVDNVDSGADPAHLFPK